MLSDPKRLRTPGGYGYLISWKHRLRVRTEPQTAAVVERILKDASNVKALRAGIGRPDATLDELAEWLVTGLSSGALNLLKTRVNPPVFDAPPETNLFDLLPPPDPTPDPTQEPKQDLQSLTFEVLENGGEGVAVRYQVRAPSGNPAGSLPPGGRGFIGDLEPSAHIEIELSAIQLPLRPDAEERPAPLGPGGIAPRPAIPPVPDAERPPHHPVGPGDEEPDRPIPGPDDRFAAAIFDTGGLCFGTDRETFIPTRLPIDEATNYRFLTGTDALRCCLEYAQSHPQLRLCVVGHTDTVGTDSSNVQLSERRAQTVQLLLANERQSWAALATENQTVADWQAFLLWAHQVMGMNCDPGEVDDDLGGRTQAALHRFRATYNSRYQGDLAIEGPFVEADWAAAFDCYRQNLAEQLGCTIDDLPTPRFTEPAAMGCGEAFPAEGPGADDRASAVNRRVDLVFVGDSENPDLTASPPGAQLYGPECTRQPQPVTASTHVMLRLVLHDEAGVPRMGLPCRLLVGDEVLVSKTTPDGYLEFRVPGSVQSATLLLEDPGGRGSEFELELGTLAAIADDAGVTGRLKNLGYESAPQDLSRSLTRFQEQCELDPTGSLDDETRDRIALEHGC